LFGPGNVPNATTGRAVRLTLLHVGGAKVGVGSKKTVGQPSHYTYCFAENEADSPWPPYFRSRGVDTPSAITVGTQEGPHNVQDHFSEDPIGILTAMATSLANIGSNTVTSLTTECYIVFGPEHAATIASAGWTREDVQLFLYERARVPWGLLRSRSSDPDKPNPNPSAGPWRVGASDTDLIPVVHHPDRFRIMVGGGAGKHSAILPAGGWGSITIPLELPS
jgi:hypothetical protein